MSTTAEAGEPLDSTAPLEEAEGSWLPQNLLKCVKCGRPMRPRGVTKAEMPGTVATGHSGMCKSDAQPNGPGDRLKKAAPEEADAQAAIAEDPVGVEDRPAEEDPEALEAARARRKAVQDLRIANTAAGLDSFMAARRKRLRGALFATEVRIAGRNVA